MCIIFFCCLEINGERRKITIGNMKEDSEQFSIEKNIMS